MRKVLALASTALAVTASTTVIPAASVSATTRELPGCPDYKLCIWTKPDFKGEVTQLRPGGGCVNATAPIRSAANTYPSGGGTDVVVAVYSGKDCTGEMLVLLPRGGSQSSFPIRTPGLSTNSAW